MFAQACLLSELFSQMSVGPLDLFVLVNVQTVFDEISLKREMYFFLFTFLKFVSIPQSYAIQKCLIVERFCIKNILLERDSWNKFIFYPGLDFYFLKSLFYSLKKTSNDAIHLYFFPELHVLNNKQLNELLINYSISISIASISLKLVKTA